MRNPIGQDNFKKIIEGKFYFVDKSLFIRDIIEDAASILLIPRPRRFGKTVNFSMLRYFFEKTQESHAGLFQNLKVNQFPESMKHQGQYPVILLSLKELKALSFEGFLKKFAELISKEYERHDWILEKKILKKRDEKRFQQILEEEVDLEVLESSLKNLTEYLHRAYEKEVIVLIDEYDAPLHEGYFNKYYDQIVSFIRNLFGAALKGNPHLEKGILTGILRVSKESIFSELNNIDVCSILTSEFSQNFGFTEEETEKILTDFGLEEHLSKVQEWYNGYLFGNVVIYNPWSILNFVFKKDHHLRPYWINTSSNQLIRDLILRETLEFQEDLKILLQKGSLEKRIEENLVLRDLSKDPEAVWSLLLFSGYLKPFREVEDEWGGKYELRIPNREVKAFFYRSVEIWLREQTGAKLPEKLLQALTTGDIPLFETILQELVKAVLSFYDTDSKKAEAVYHAFTLGLLVYLEGRYQINSNREGGYGRYDVMLSPKNPQHLGIVFEFKSIKENEEDEEENEEKPKKKKKSSATLMKESMQEALNQIRTKDYAAELRTAGVNRIMGIGIVFRGKKVYVDSIELSPKK